MDEVARVSAGQIFQSRRHRTYGNFIFVFSAWAHATLQAARFLTLFVTSESVSLTLSRGYVLLDEEPCAHWRVHFTDLI